MLVEERDPSAPVASAAKRSEWRASAILLWLTIPLVLVVVHVLQTFEIFNTVGCEGVCDLDLVFAARSAYPWAVLGSVAFAVIAAFVLAARKASPLWAPLIGLVLVVTSALVTSVVVQSGFAPMYERNERAARGELPTPAPEPLPDPTGLWGTGVEGTPFLRFAADGALIGYDGCNDVNGSWAQSADGTIAFSDLSFTERFCDGVDTWLSLGRSAMIREEFLFVNGETGSTIGGLPPAPTAFAAGG